MDLILGQDPLQKSCSASRWTDDKYWGSQLLFAVSAIEQFIKDSAKRIEKPHDQAKDKYY